MADPIFHCKECDTQYPYHEVTKKFDPRPGARRTRTICFDCYQRITSPDPKASDFSVERNFKKAGTSSQAAHQAAESARLGDTHRKIYSALLSRPMTADEAAKATGINLLTVRPRMSDLRKAGWIEATGDTRPTDCGKQADVMRAVSAEERSAA